MCNPNWPGTTNRAPGTTAHIKNVLNMPFHCLFFFKFLLELVPCKFLFCNVKSKVRLILGHQLITHKIHFDHISRQNQILQ